MILPDVRDAVLAQTTRALQEQLRDTSPTIGQLAEALVAIAISYHVPIEMLVEWIRQDVPRKQWSAAEWRRWCEWYRNALLDSEPAESSADGPVLGVPFSACARD